jgi:protein SFI1
MAFQPTRASPPSRLSHLDRVAAITAEISRASAANVPELTDLTPLDIRIIDAVIQRAAPSATTFLAIFKAYNDILLEHGLDPHEVLYYGKLLKLGTIKGKTWGEKWRTAKLQYGYTDGDESSDFQQTIDQPPKMMSTLPSAKVPTPVEPHFRVPRRDDDSFTLHSHRDDSEFRSSDADTGIDVTQYHQPSQPPFSLPSEIKTNSLGLAMGSLDHPTRTLVPKAYVRPPVLNRNTTTWDTASSEDRGTAPTLPSYKTTVRDTPSFELPRPQPKRDRLAAFPVVTPSAARQAIAQARERQGGVVNEDDAWSKIKMAQDEKEADIFREDRLVERCWDVWRQALHWVLVCNNFPTTFTGNSDFFRPQTNKLGKPEIPISSV